MENTNTMATIEFIEKIEALVTDKIEASKEEPKVYELNGKKYLNRTDLEILKRESCGRTELSSLKAVVDFVSTTIENNKDNVELPLLIYASHGNVNVVTSLDEHNDRNVVAIACPQNPNIRFNDYLSMEAFIIQLQTCFVDSKNKKILLDQVKYFSSESKVEAEDDGIGQKVVATQGTAIKKEISLQPIINLTAYRTYKEVEQPETMYLLRVRDGGQIALFEADGGMWKHDATLKVSAYLRKELAKLIEAGSVVVVG